MTRHLDFAATLIVALVLAAPAFAVQQKKAVACDGGAFPGGGCRTNEFCQAPTGQCFFTFQGGTCTLVPQVCLNNVRQVCGCDGNTYSNDCKRRQARVSKVKEGRC